MQLDFLTELDTTIIPENIYYCINFAAFRDKWINSKIYTLDIETASKTPANEGLNPWRNEIRLIQIALSDRQVYVCDLWKDANKNDFLAILKKTLADPQIIKVGHTIYFDLLCLKVHFNFDAHTIRDTQIFSQILCAGQKGFALHSLKAVATRLGLEISKQEQTSDWSRPNLTNSQILYSANDVLITYEVYKRLGKQIKEESRYSLFGNKPLFTLAEIAQIECNAVPAFVDFTYHGFNCDQNLINDYIDQYTFALDSLRKPLEEALGLDYTSASEKLAIAIKEKLGVNLASVHDQEKASTEASSLIKASEQHHLLLNLVLCRSLKQSIDALKRLLASAKHFQDNRVRGWFQPLGDTGTGRSTCSGGGKRNTFVGLNLQNVPKPIEHPLLDQFNLPNIRDCLCAPEGRQIAIIDLSASHQRLVASKKLSGDPFLQKVLSDPKLDKLSHSILASDIAKLKGLNYTAEEIESGRKQNPELDKLRSISKTRFYSGLNKAGWRTVQAKLLEDFIICSAEDAKKSTKAFNTRYKGINDFQDRTLHHAQRTQTKIKIGSFYYHPIITEDGRLYYSIVNRNYQNKEAINLSDALSIQWLSPEAIAMKKTMIEFREYLLQTHSSTKLILMVHDELVLETDQEADVSKCLELLAANFQYVLGDDIPHGINFDPKKYLAKHYSEK